MHESATYYWIYILKEENTALFNINYAVNYPDGIEQTKAKLVYYRCYDNIIDALGHKLFLEQISKASLKRIIKMQNPKNKNLWNRI